jgi:hypothetical protein
MRLGQQERGGAGVDVHLKAQELYGPKLLYRIWETKNCPRIDRGLKKKKTILI